MGFIEPYKDGGGGVTHRRARAAKAARFAIYKNVTDVTIVFNPLFVYICVAFKNSHFFNGLKLAYNSAF